MLYFLLARTELARLFIAASSGCPVVLAGTDSERMGVQWHTESST